MRTESYMSQFRTVMLRYQRNQMTRRQAIRALGGAGLSLAAATALVGNVRRVSAHQDGTPHADDLVLGEREDGTSLWKVQVGGMDMETVIDLHAFFPGEITINAGDSIYFELAPMGMPGFHTVTFMDEPIDLFLPDIVDGEMVMAPEGMPRLLLNPELMFPVGGDTYDGTGYLNSGIDLLREPTDPFIVTFTAPGTYEYVCLVHEVVMRGTVVVQEAGSDLTQTQEDYDAIAAEERAALIAIGEDAIAALDDVDPAEDGSAWNVAAGAGGFTQARVMRFLPQEITISVGDTVRWTNLSIGEPHTVTFLGGEEQPQDAIIEPQEVGPPKFIQNYQTLLPIGDAEFDGTGYHNSGFLGLPPELGEPLGLLGDTYELTFTEPGEYSYYCVLHAGGPDDQRAMAGKVIVEG